MKFHKSLIPFTAINFVTCLVFFFILDGSSPMRDRVLNGFLGWIGWLGVLTFIVPVCYSDETRAAWFSKEYGTGTLLLLFLNVLAAIAGAFIAYTLTK